MGERSRMQGTWLRRPCTDPPSPLGSLVVVFVHGILSSGEDCWRGKEGQSWPELLLDDPNLEFAGVYLFTYQTGVFSGSYSISDVADALKEHGRLDGVWACSRIVFVCHSMGGIVARKFIVDRGLLELTDRRLGLFLVASPSLGSSYADLFKLFARAFGHEQGAALRLVNNNPWLRDLDASFTNLKESHTLSLVGKELVEDKPVIFPKLWFLKQVVQPFAGARYFGEHFKVPLSDHFSIAKPSGKEAIQHRLLCEFIRDLCCSPDISKGLQDALGHAGVTGESQTSATPPPDRAPTALALFDVYDVPCAPYYEYRQFDEQLSVESKDRSIWVWGPTGTGKTSAIRYLFLKESGYLFVPLAACVGASIPEMVEFILLEVSDRLGHIVKPTGRRISDTIVALVNVIKKHGKRDLLVHIDEIPIDDPKQHAELTSVLGGLIIQHRASGQNVRYLLSSIDGPPDPQPFQAKLSENLSVLRAREWAEADLLKLVRRLMPTIELHLSEDQVLNIVRGAGGLPRVVKARMRRLIALRENSDQSLDELITVCSDEAWP